MATVVSGFLRDPPAVNSSLGALVTSDPSTQARFEGGKLAKTAQVTVVGDTTVHTPAAGKALALYWVSAINDPDASVSPLISIGFAGAATYLYSAYAIAHFEVFEGVTDQSLIVNLDQAGAVAITLHYREI